MIRTAIPLGYLFIFLALGGLFLTGVACFILGWRRRIRWLKSMGAIASLAVVGLLTAEVIMDSLLEWNPPIRDDAEVLGTWQRERSFWMDCSETLVLRADHTFDYKSDTEGFTGKWQRDDWNLRIQTEEVDSLMRFILFSGKLRLMTKPLGDPDTWNGDLGLKRVSEPASERQTPNH